MVDSRSNLILTLALKATLKFSATASPGMPVRIMHQVLDEIATEKRAQYDDRNNKVVGVCGQHGHKLPLNLSSEDDLGVLCDGLRRGGAHLAGKVCSISTRINVRLKLSHSYCVGNIERKSL
jgi:hypothetical protein